jgi:hypothetical protein
VGPQGEIGPTGPEGDSITVRESVPDIFSLPEEGNTKNDLIYVEAEGVLFSWSGEEWFGVGQIKGDTGPQGYPINFLGVVELFEDLPEDAEFQDAYLVTNEENVYFWNGLEWQNIGPILGPQGEIGPTGPQGSQGVAGNTGPQGETGPAGGVNFLYELGDVDVSEVEDGNALIYNEETETWVPGEGGGGGGKFTISETTPEDPTPGDVWFDSTSGISFIYYNDEDGEQWVEIGDTAGGPTGPSGVVGATGPTGPTGDTGPGVSLGLVIALGA